MSYYQKYLKKDSEFEKLIEDAGRCCHQVRNYTQGYVNLNHPEIQTIDNISGQMEGQLRVLKSNLHQNVEMKPVIITCAKLSNFNKKMISKGVFADEFEIKEQQKFKNITALINTTLNIIQHIDYKINLAIIEMSQELFSSNVKSIDDYKIEHKCTEKANYEINVEDEFKAEFDESTEEVESDPKKLLSKIGFKLSNNSHFIQEQVADFIQILVFKDTANKIIQLAGEIENQGRAIIAEGVISKDNINIKNINKYLTNSNNSVSQLKDIAFKQCDYLVKNYDNNHNRITNTIIAIEKALAQAENIIQRI